MVPEWPRRLIMYHTKAVCRARTTIKCPGWAWTERWPRVWRRLVTLTVEDARRRVLSDHGAVLLIAVVPAVIQLVADQWTQAQTIPIGAVELALCSQRKQQSEDKYKGKTHLSYYYYFFFFVKMFFCSHGHSLDITLETNIITGAPGCDFMVQSFLDLFFEG